MESASSGLIAGIAMARRLRGLPPLELPETTMLGALTRYISSSTAEDFQPMGSNMGILPPPSREDQGQGGALWRTGCPCHAGSGTDPERFGGISYENYR